MEAKERLNGQAGEKPGIHVEKERGGKPSVAAPLSLPAGVVFSNIGKKIKAGGRVLY